MPRSCDGRSKWSSSRTLLPGHFFPDAALTPDERSGTISSKFADVRPYYTKGASWIVSPLSPRFMLAAAIRRVAARRRWTPLLRFPRPSCCCRSSGVIRTMLAATQAVSPRIRWRLASRRNPPRFRRLRYEALEARCLPSGGNLLLTLPGMQLANPDSSHFEGQLIYLDFDGAQNVAYNGPRLRTAPRPPPTRSPCCSRFSILCRCSRTASGPL